MEEEGEKKEWGERNKEKCGKKMEGGEEDKKSRKMRGKNGGNENVGCGKASRGNITYREGRMKS